MKRTWLACLLAFLAIVATIAVGTPAVAARFVPPPLEGHVVDGTNTLTGEQRAEIDRKLEDFRQRTGFAIVAFVVPSLEGSTIEDVAYDTFNTWKVGEAGKDNGVLLVIAPNDRRSRIETGKGVGGALTDLESAEILRGYVTPAMRDGDLRRAVDDGTSAIEKALSDELPIGANGTPAERPAPAPSWTHWLFIGVILLVGLLALISPTFRWVLLGILQGLIFNRGGGGRGGFSGGGFGGGGGGGYSGGGGSSGGGGASDSY